MTISSTPSLEPVLTSFVQERHHGLGPFEREALLPDIARVQKLLKLFGGDQPREYPARRFFGQIWIVEARLDPLL